MLNLFLLAKRYGISVETETIPGEPDTYIFFKDREMIGELAGGKEAATKWLEEYISEEGLPLIPIKER